MLEMIGMMELNPSMGVEHRERKKKKDKGGPGWLLLTPFRPVIMAVLKSKGISHKGTNKELAYRFYKDVMKRPLPANFQEYDGSYDKGTSGHLDPVTITMITQAIITWIKNLKKKKDSGEPMTKEEEKILEISETAAKTGQQVVKDEAEEGIGAWILENKMIVLVGAAVLAYFVFKK